VKMVTILGCGPGVPRRLPPGEVWYPNFRPRRPDIRRRLTRAFQMHPVPVLVDRERQWLRACPVPIYTLTRLSKETAPNGVPYPQALVRHGLPFCSSFDYMMALALSEGFDAILLAGIHLQQGTLRERLAEHVSLAYWIGLIRGQKGLRSVQIAPTSHVLKMPFRYGWDYHQERRWGQALARDALQQEQLDDGVATTRRRRGIVRSGRRALGTPARD